MLPRWFTETAPIAIAVLDCELHYINCTHQWLTQHNFSPADLIGKNYLTLHPPSNIGLTEMFERFRLGHHVAWDHTVELTGPENGRQIFQWRLSSWRSEADGRQGLIIVSTPIHAELTRGAELLHSERVLATVLDVLPQRIFWKDREGRYLGSNRVFRQDCNVANIAGMTDYDMPWSREEADFYRSCDRRVMESNVPELDIIETQTLS